MISILIILGLVIVLTDSIRLSLMGSENKNTVELGLDDSSLWLYYVAYRSILGRYLRIP